MTSDTFTPRWVSPPGDTLAMVLPQFGLTTDDVERRLGRSSSWMSAFWLGDGAIDDEVACRLSEMTGLSACFWAERELQYRESLDRISADLWVQRMPTDEMVKLGWISRVQRDDWQARIRVTAAFFGYESPADWERLGAPLLASAHFRAAPAFSPDRYAVLAWMRKCETAGSPLRLALDVEALRDELSSLRRLARMSDPAAFIPEISQRLGRCGLRFVVQRAPRGCSINGATWRTRDGESILALTARHLSDDQLWYTFFHEVSHVLLHSDAGPFVDTFDSCDGESGVDAELPSLEREADALAPFMLLADPPSVFEAKRPRSVRDIVRLAHRNETSPGVIVGQLQRVHTLEYSERNSLKRRYSWNGITLEKR